jgi:predicted transcriptional regulator
VHHRLVSLSDINLDRRACQDWSVVARLTSETSLAPPHAAIHRVLARLPVIEQDIVQLYFFHNKTEVVIARLLGLSQQAVSYRLRVAYRRLRFLLDQPEISEARMRRDLARLIADPLTVDVLCSWAHSSSQAMTSAQLALPQQRVGRRIVAGLKILREATDDVEALFYTSYFERLLRHRNFFRERLLTDAVRAATVRESRTHRGS